MVPKSQLFSAKVIEVVGPAGAAASGFASSRAGPFSCRLRQLPSGQRPRTRTFRCSPPNLLLQHRRRRRRAGGEGQTGKGNVRCSWVWIVGKINPGWGRPGLKGRGCSAGGRGLPMGDATCLVGSVPKHLDATVVDGVDGIEHLVKAVVSNRVRARMAFRRNSMADRLLFQSSSTNATSSDSPKATSPSRSSCSRAVFETKESRSAYCCSRRARLASTYSRTERLNSPFRSRSVK